MRITRNQQEAEDVVQEVFAKVWKKKEEIEYGDAIAGYLFGAVKHACLNKARHMKVVKQYEQEKGHQSSMIENPHHYLMLNEIEQKIEATLNTFPDKAKDVFIMSRYQQKKNREIADLLNISIKTVEAHMTKVLAALRTNLQHYISILLLIIINA